MHRGSGNSLPSFMEEGSVKDNDNQNGDVGADTKSPNKRIFRSYLMRMHHVQNFIQQKQYGMSSVVADLKPIAKNYPDTSIMFADNITNFTLGMVRLKFVHVSGA